MSRGLGVLCLMLLGLFLGVAFSQEESKTSEKRAPTLREAVDTDRIWGFHFEGSKQKGEFLELARPDIDGVDPARAALQENVRKPAGGGPEIKADEAGGTDVEGVEGRRELHAASRDKGVDVARHVNLIVSPHHMGRLAGDGVADLDETHPDRGLRPRAARERPGLDQKGVEATLLAAAHSAG